MSVSQNFQERARFQFGEAQARPRQRLFPGDCAGVDRAQEEVEQSLAGSSVVEDAVGQRGPRGIRDEVMKPLRSLLQPLQKERVDRRVTCRKLGGMKVQPW